MVDVFVTFLHSNSLPKLFNSLYQFFLRCRFNNSSIVLLQFVPKIFYWITIRWFSWGTPPSYFVLRKKVLRIVGSMLGIIVGQKTAVVAWINYLKVVSSPILLYTEVHPLSLWRCRSLLVRVCRFQPKHAPWQDVLPCKEIVQKYIKFIIMNII